VVALNYRAITDGFLSFVVGKIMARKRIIDAGRGKIYFKSSKKHPSDDYAFSINHVSAKEQ